MAKELAWIPLLRALLILLLCSTSAAAVGVYGERTPSVVRRGDRKQLLVTEYGQISSVDVVTAARGPYHIEFITLNPNSLFLPVLLHADMVFYVHTGSGKLSWGDGDDVKSVDLRRGDVYKLESGSVFFLQSALETERQNLRVHAIFTTAEEDIWEPSIGAYSRVSDLVLGFDNKLLQSAFGVPEDVISELTTTPKPQGIVHGIAEESEDKKKKSKWAIHEMENRFLKMLVAGEGRSSSSNGKLKKSKTFNILDADPDFHNCNGWSISVDKGDYKSLKGSHVGIFMVNLTKGAMMGPHWNPMATEIAVVLQGEGMVRVVCASNSTGCKDRRFMVGEGDVFVVPRFHPMAQMSFNNASFVFMGFSTTSKKNHPQFLAGKQSVLQTLDKDVLAVAFNVSNTTIEGLLAAQEDAVILECVSCAEEELRILKEEIEREKEKEEEEREEEEEERKRQEEEERKKREEEERKRREEEEEEEERKKREEEEEEERKRKEEEAARRREEEARREQEEARKAEEERQRRREEAEEEAERRREEEEEEKRRQEEEEEERQRREEEAARERRREEEEEEKRRQEEEEEERQRREEEAAREEEEEARKEEEERQRREEEEEERQRREEEEEERRREEVEEKQRRQQEEERERREEEGWREQEEARREEKGRQRRKRKEQGGGGEEEEEHGGGGGSEGRRAFKRNPWSIWM